MLFIQKFIIVLENCFFQKRVLDLLNFSKIKQFMKKMKRRFSFFCVNREMLFWRDAHLTNEEN